MADRHFYSEPNVTSGQGIEEGGRLSNDNKWIHKMLPSSVHIRQWIAEEGGIHFNVTNQPSKQLFRLQV